MTASSVAVNEISATQRALWDRFAGEWERWDRVVDSVHGPVVAAMIAVLRIGDDQQHLDVASGTGEPGLTIAGLAAHGRVTRTDAGGCARGRHHRGPVARATGAEHAGRGAVTCAAAACTPNGIRIGVATLRDSPGVWRLTWRMAGAARRPATSRT